MKIYKKGNQTVFDGKGSFIITDNEVMLDIDVRLQNHPIINFTIISVGKSLRQKIETSIAAIRYIFTHTSPREVLGVRFHEKVDKKELMKRNIFRSRWTPTEM